MGKLPADRLPIGPLLDAIETRDKPRTQWGESNLVTHVARCVGVSRERVHAASHRGLTPTGADRWAIRAGFHPCEIWSEWFTPDAYDGAMTKYENLEALLRAEGILDECDIQRMVRTYRAFSEKLLAANDPRFLAMEDSSSDVDRLLDEVGA